MKISRPLGDCDGPREWMRYLHYSQSACAFSHQARSGGGGGWGFSIYAKRCLVQLLHTASRKPNDRPGRTYRAGQMQMQACVVVVVSFLLPCLSNSTVGDP